MAKKVLIKNGSTEAVNGWTSKIYYTSKRDGGVGCRITATNDYISIRSNYVSEKKNYFILPNTQTETSTGDTRSYDNIKLSDFTRQAILSFGGTHIPLYQRKPDLDAYEMMVTDQVSDGQKKAGILAKMTLKGEDWEVPNICIFKDGSGEVTFSAPSGITIHPLVLMEMGEYACEVLEDVERETPSEAEYDKYLQLMKEIESTATEAEAETSEPADESLSEEDEALLAQIGM